MKGPKMSHLREMMPFAALQEMVPAIQNGKRLTMVLNLRRPRSMITETLGIYIEEVGTVDCRIQFDLHHPMWLPSGSGQVLNIFRNQYRAEEST